MQSEKTNFSFIVPVYNVEKYLCQCVDSILQQTYPFFEIILVDDGSVDSSASICDEYARKDERVKVIHKPNGGLSSARNEGIIAAKGDYLIFLDSDDYWNSPYALEKISETIDQGDKDSVVCWRYIKKSREIIEKETDKKILTAGTTIYHIERDGKKLLSRGILFASAWYLALPKTFFKEKKLFFEIGKTSEDIEWFAVLLAKLNKIYFIDYPILKYRQRKGSISKTIKEKNITDYKEHLKNIETMISEISGSKEILRAYYAEQVANYILVLSVYEGFSAGKDFSKTYRKALKYSVRRRSKIVRLMVNTIGINATVKILRTARRK